jgi:putative transposase
VKSVVLVHSGFVDGSGWEGVYDVLKKDGYDVLRRTTRKHGVASERCEQRCWVHEAANVLAKLPKSQQPKAKRALQEIWMAETKAIAELAFDAFIESYALKYAKAADCLSQDRDALLAFYDFPAEHWKHLRTTNPIESTFATVRHRTIRSNSFSV